MINPRTSLTHTHTITHTPPHSSNENHIISLSDNPHRFLSLPRSLSFSPRFCFICLSPSRHHSTGTFCSSPPLSLCFNFYLSSCCPSFKSYPYLTITFLSVVTSWECIRPCVLHCAVIDQMDSIVCLSLRLLGIWSLNAKVGALVAWAHHSKIAN